jgi:hypothetical protein
LDSWLFAMIRYPWAFVMYITSGGDVCRPLTLVICSAVRSAGCIEVQQSKVSPYSPSSYELKFSRMCLMILIARLRERVLVPPTGV